MLSVTTGTNAYQYKSMFTSMDKNSDGVLSQDEFLANSPTDVSAQQESQLYSSLNTSGNGAMTLDEYQSRSTSAVQSASGKLTSEIMSMVLDLIQQLQQSASASGAAGGGAAADGERFAEIDTDGDGSVTAAEFVASRPEDISEEEANALFESLDADGAGALTEEQLEEAMRTGGAGGPPPGGPPPALGETSTDSDDDDDDANGNQIADVLEDVIERLSMILDAYRDTELDQTEKAAAQSDQAA